MGSNKDKILKLQAEQKSLEEKLNLIKHELSIIEKEKGHTKKAKCNLYCVEAILCEIEQYKTFNSVATDLVDETILNEMIEAMHDCKKYPIIREGEIVEQNDTYYENVEGMPICAENIDKYFEDVV